MLYIDPMAVSGAIRFDPEGASMQRRETAFRELEKYFAHTLLREMRKTVPENTLFGGHEMRTYEEFLDDAFAGEIAGSGQLGVAEMLERQLRIEEMQHQLRGRLGNGLEALSEEGPAEIE